MCCLMYETQGAHSWNHFLNKVIINFEERRLSKPRQF